jgi:hypothetical protein
LQADSESCVAPNFILASDSRWKNAFVDEIDEQHICDDDDFACYESGVNSLIKNRLYNARCYKESKDANKTLGLIPQSSGIKFKEYFQYSFYPCSQEWENKKETGVTCETDTLKMK